MKKLGLILRENIEQIIDKEIKDSNNAFVITYSNVSASDFNSLRLELRKVGARLFVAKNTSARRALGKRKLDKMTEFIEGPTAFVWGSKESVSVSKILSKFAKEREGIKLRGGLLEEQIIDANRVRDLANLPTKEILLTMVLRAIQSPIYGIVNVLNYNLRQLVFVLKQLSEQKGGEQK